MKPLIAAACSLSLLAACDTPEQSAALGAATGAAIGAATACKREDKGAALGAVAGGIAGLVAHGASQGAECRYRYPDGTETYAPCPE